MEQKIGIVGAGLVGSLLAAQLAKRGFTVDVFERRPDLRNTDISAGKSINLALSDRGIVALQNIGMEEQMRSISIPMHGRLLHDNEGHTNLMPYGKEGQYINSISRGDLNARLMTLAEKSEKVNIYFNRTCLDVNLDEAEITLKNEINGDIETKKYDRIIGTDGAFSAVRTRMMKTDRFNYSQNYISSGYKELTMPPVPNTKWAIDKSALHIWPRKEFMLIALPNLDGSFTCTLFMPFTGPEGFDALDTDDKVMAFFNKYFKDAVPHMPTLINDWHENATSSLVTVKCEPWNYKDKVLVMGDSAHAIVPFYGQGMNAGFEDVKVFNDYLDKYSDWGQLFDEYAQFRKPDADAIAELAVRNYIEMRDLVADPHFVKKRALSAKINELFPEQWMPLYSMVTFSHIRYSDALAKGDWQNEVLEKLVAKGISASSNNDEISESLKPFIG